MATRLYFSGCFSPKKISPEEVDQTLLRIPKQHLLRIVSSRRFKKDCVVKRQCYGGLNCICRHPRSAIIIQRIHYLIFPHLDGSERKQFFLWQCLLGSIAHSRDVNINYYRDLTKEESTLSMVSFKLESLRWVVAFEVFCILLSDTYIDTIMLSTTHITIY